MTANIRGVLELVRAVVPMSLVEPIVRAEEQGVIDKQEACERISLLALGGDEDRLDALPTSVVSLHKHRSDPTVCLVLIEATQA